MNDQGELVLVYTGDRVLEVYEQIRDNGMMSDYDTLLDKIKTKQATVCVIGLGYVGLPLCRNLVEAGYNVVGIDQDERKITAIWNDETYLKHLDPKTVIGMRETGRFKAFAQLSDSGGKPDVFIICVPTPLNKNGGPDIGYVDNACLRIRTEAINYPRPMLAILESSTYPGTTREMLGGYTKDTEYQFVSGCQIFAAYSPERENPGSDLDSRKVTKLVGGLNEESTRLATALYQTMYPVHVCESAEVAEAAKLLENTFRYVNIGLIHELNETFKALGINTHSVIDAAATKPFGFMAFRPSAGVGGACIPDDPHYLAWVSRNVNKSTRFIDESKYINDARKQVIIDEIWRQIRIWDKDRDYPHSAYVLFLGSAYKPNVADERGSSSKAIYDYFAKHEQFNIALHDPSIYPNHAPLAPSHVQDSIVVLGTPHSFYDLKMIVENAAVVIDPHGACRHLKSPKVIAV